MKVLQLPVDVAGQVGLTVEGLRDIGVDAKAAYTPHAFGYDAPDVALPSGLASLPRMPYAWRLGGYDVYHYHFGVSLFPNTLRFFDARRFARSAAVTCEWWGADCRLEAIDRPRNPYWMPMPNHNEKATHERMRRWSRITNGHALAADHVMADHLALHFDEIDVVRQRIRLDMEPAYPTEVEEPLVVHVPSDAYVKGTDVVVAAVARLREQGARFRFRLLSGVTHDEAMQAVAEADVVIDQLRLGSHGIFAIEAMAYGKPVVCYTMPAVRDGYPRPLPLVDATPEDLVDVLRGLLEDAPRRRRLGKEGRAYVEAVHDHRVVAEDILSVYERLERR